MPTRFVELRTHYVNLRLSFTDGNIFFRGNYILHYPRNAKISLEIEYFPGGKQKLISNGIDLYTLYYFWYEMKAKLI
jgi:hypothetical protein